MNSKTKAIVYWILLAVSLVLTVVFIVFPFNAMGVGMHNDGNSNMQKYCEVYRMHDNNIMSLKFESEDNGIAGIYMYFRPIMNEDLAVDFEFSDDACIHYYLFDENNEVICENTKLFSEMIFPRKYSDRPSTLLELDAHSVKKGDELKLVITLENAPEEISLAICGMKNIIDEDTGEWDESFIDEKMIVDNNGMQNKIVPMYKIVVPVHDRPMLLIFVLIDLFIFDLVILHKNGVIDEKK